MSRSLSRQLALLFGLGLLVTLIVGGVGIFGARDITRTVSDARQQDVPNALSALDLSGSAAHFQLLAMAYLGQDLLDEDTAEQIVHARTELTSSLEGTATSPSDIEAFAARLDEALMAHDALGRLVFRFEGRTFTLVDFLNRIAVEQATYLRTVNEAARFRVFDGVPLDPKETTFSRWRATYSAPDAEFQALLDDVASREAALIEYVAEKLASDPERAEAQFIRMQSRRLPPLQRSLDALIAETQGRFADLSAQKAAAVAALRSEISQITEDAAVTQREAMSALTNAIDAAEKEGQLISITVVIALVAGAIVALGATTYAIRGIGRPLARLSGVITSFGDGKFEAEVPYVTRADELGTIARASAQFRDGQIWAQDARAEEERRSQEQKASLQVLASHLVRLSNGDLTCRIEGFLPQEYKSIRMDFNETVIALTRAITDITGSAKQIDSSVHEIANATDDLARRTESSAASLHETGETLSRLTQLVAGAARDAAEASDMAGAAKLRAEESSPVLKDSAIAMSDISASFEKIVQIVDLVDDIAFQTNLLALNAAVEAARAGEAGRGFGVVAHEVQSLAQRSAEAADDIRTIISESGENVSRGVSLVNGAVDRIEGIVEAVDQVATVIRQIASASQEQSLGITDINDAVEKLSVATQQNAAVFEQTSAATRSLTEEASILSQLTARFTIDEEGHLVPQPKSATQAAA